MKKKSLNLDVGSLLTGMALGAGFVVYRNMRERKDPENAPGQRRINNALNNALRRARKKGKLKLEATHRYVIFSDHHKGGRDKADDFRFCESTYLEALDYYFENDYTLVILGDAEELLEQDISTVVEAYGNVLLSEARFHPDRHFRVPGNHDIWWRDNELVEQYLHPFFPGLEYRDALVFEYADDMHTSGDIFLVHGHQGTLDSDIFGFLPPIVLPFYRGIQNLTGLGATSPSRDVCLRAAHDTHMYRWASKKEKLILVSGHTHRPVWSSMTHLEKLRWQLVSLLQLEPEDRPADYEQQLDRLLFGIDRRQEKYPPCTDTFKTQSCYFNTGCCRFEDGDITGIELEDGVMRLIKWGEEEGSVVRKVFEENHLSNIFALL